MTINVFEGARRIAKLIALFIVVGFGIAIITESPRTENIFFTITRPGQPPVIGCGPGGDNVELKSKYTVTRRGKGVELTLCFKEHEFVTAQQGKIVDPYDKMPWRNDPVVQMLVPYYVDKATGRLWGNTKSSPEVMQYMSNALDAFQIPEAEEDRINNLWWSNKLELAGMYFLGMLASLTAWWAFTWTVGWIVRGFMGIPRGSDSRE